MLIQQSLWKKWMKSLQNIYDQQSYDPLDNEDIYTFLQPELNADGSCPIFKKAGERYDLRKWHDESEKNFKFIKSLKQYAEYVQDESDLSWFGIYILKNNNLLVKYAYSGEFSKAEFPVTEENTKKSVNATVAYYKKLVHIENVETFEGAYYRCDAKVKSELCLPLMHEKKCIGIIDCEDHRVGFFTKKINTFQMYTNELSAFISEHLQEG
jgi:L-methionine (R)-S-oxide reductase